MSFRVKFSTTMLFLILCGAASPLWAQQKGQWVPGQFGLNAGVIPDPGFTYANLALNYSAGQLNNPNGNAFPGITGTYSFWVDENIIYYVPKHKILGGYFMPYVALNYASGELVADITLGETNLERCRGWIRLCRHVRPAVEPRLALREASRLQRRIRFHRSHGPIHSGASNNVGSGYWGNDITTGTTLLHHQEPRNQANLATAWEIHGHEKDGTNIKRRARPSP